MIFTGFNKNDFETFQIEGLEARMEAIQTRIQPKFKEIGERLTMELSTQLGNEMFLHIAKHARRKVNPPKDTWLAICNNKRGYKQHPHFQLGLFDDHIFIWLAFIYELPQKKEIAANFINNIETLENVIPNDYVISMDHMKKDAEKMSNLGEDGLNTVLERFQTVKKAEFLVGRHISADNSLVSNGEGLIQFTKETYETLLPLYKLAYQ